MPVPCIEVPPQALKRLLHVPSVVRATPSRAAVGPAQDFTHLVQHAQMPLENLDLGRAPAAAAERHAGPHRAPVVARRHGVGPATVTVTCTVRFSGPRGGAGSNGHLIDGSDRSGPAGLRTIGTSAQRGRIGKGPRRQRRAADFHKGADVASASVQHIALRVAQPAGGARVPPEGHCRGGVGPEGQRQQEGQIRERAASYARPFVG
jgi:hypothetical protein